MSIKNGIFEMIGKTIKAVIVNEECDPYPNYHVFIVFNDNQTYEFFGEGRIHSTSGLYNGPGYAKALTNCRKIKQYSKDDKGREIVEDITSKSKCHNEQEKVGIMTADLDAVIADELIGRTSKKRGRVNSCQCCLYYRRRLSGRKRYRIHVRQSTDI